MKKIYKKFKTFFLRFFLINDTPHRVALGAALGTFLGIIPGEGITATIVLATLFRLNKLSAIAAAAATNMWTTIVLLPIAAFIGGKLFGLNPQILISDFKRSFDLGWKYFMSKTVLLDLTLPLIVGYVFTAILFSVIFYFVLYFLLKNKKVKLY